jgi:exosortase E/protease (VPEID-CTERM system)
LAFALLLLGEGLVLGLRFDTAAIQGAGHQWWSGLIARVSVVMPLAVAAATAAALFAGERLREEFRRLSAELAVPRVAWPFIIAHLAAFLTFTWITAMVLEHGRLSESATPELWATAWVTTGLATVGLWSVAVFPPTVLVALLRRAGTILLAATAIGVAAWGAGQVTADWWYPLRHGTLRVVHAIVGLFGDAIVEPNDYVVGTRRFTVEISAECSGYEGIGLIWVFLGVYLLLFRRSLRFPQALLLLPLGTALVWLANALRIAALIAIGTWISPEIAFGGFHSYAGSLLFCAVALSLAHVAGRSRFFATADALEATADTRNPTAAYLGPFLAIVATAMLTGAFSTGTFDALYPLRVVVAAMMLWSFRTVYREWRWTWSWHAVALGIGVFFLWMALEPAATTETPDSDLGTILAGMPAGAAGTWLAFRAFGAIVTVPIVEELAFRGYLLRRFVAADFEGVSPRRFSAPAFLISSVLFGAMHSRLLAGTLAGMAYALALQRRGELCDAVVAHATTNAVLAAYVLATGAWSLWG